MLGQRACAEMRLQRDVAEILEGQNAQAVRVPDNCRHRQAHALEQAGDIDEGQRRHFDWALVQREHQRRSLGGDDAEVAAGGGVAGQRDDGARRRRDAAPAQVFVDPTLLAVAHRARSLLRDVVYDDEVSAGRARGTTIPAVIVLAAAAVAAVSAQFSDSFVASRDVPAIAY